MRDSINDDKLTIKLDIETKRVAREIIEKTTFSLKRNKHQKINQKEIKQQLKILKMTLNIVVARLHGKDQPFYYIDYFNLIWNKGKKKFYKDTKKIIHTAYRMLFFQDYFDRFRERVSQIDNQIISSNGLLKCSSIEPTNCLLLKNMFQPKKMNPNENWEVKFYFRTLEFVKEIFLIGQCPFYGKRSVKHIFVDKNSQGFIYIKLETVESAIKIYNSLNAYLKAIKAEYQLVHLYDDAFNL